MFSTTHANHATLIRRRVLRRSMLLGIWALVALAAVLWAPPGAQAAASLCQWQSFDFDTDDEPDIAVGAPAATVAGAEGAGRVEVQLSHSQHPYTVAVTAPSPHAGDGFGTSIGEVTADYGQYGGCSLLTVGAPGRDVDGRSNAGSVFVFRFVDGRFQLVAELRPGHDGVPGPAQAGARFGSSLSSELHLDPVINGSPLYVGAPGWDVAAVRDAGSVARLVLATSNGRLTVTAARLLTQAASDVAGSASTGARFGASLAGGASNKIIVGAPGTTVGAAAGAGSVILWRTTGAPGPMITQATTGVPGTPEAADGFGTTLYGGSETSGWSNLSIGTPNEDIGSKRDAGAVTVIPYGPLRSIPSLIARDSVAWDQNSRGVAGTVEAGDRFGSALALSTGPEQGTYVLVGVPGEDIGSDSDTGMVETLGGSHQWHQDTRGIPGSNETGDRFGTALSTLYALLGDTPTIIVGTPGEDGGTGAVTQLTNGRTRLTPQHRDAGQHFGDTVAHQD